MLRLLVWSLNNISFLLLCFGSLSISTVKHFSVSFAKHGWIWAQSTAQYTSEFILALLSAVTYWVRTADLVPLTTIHTHTIALSHHAPYISLLVSLVQSNLADICLKIFFQHSFICFWQSLNLNSLYFHSWTRLLIVDLDSGMPESSSLLNLIRCCEKSFSFQRSHFFHSTL